MGTSAGPSAPNLGKKQLQLQPHDAEGHNIQQYGVSAIVYSEELWADPDALRAVMKEDNLNSETELAEGEISAFGRVHEVVDERLTANTRVSASDILAVLRRGGLAPYSEEQWMALILFRLPLPSPIADIYKECLFNMTAGRVTTEIDNYRRAANTCT